MTTRRRAPRPVAPRKPETPPPAPDPAPATATPALDRDLAFALDPALLFEAAVGGPPDEWEARLLRDGAARVLVNCCRQSGKSTTSAVLAYHAAVYEPRSLVLLVAPGVRQSGELFRKVLDVHRAVGGSVSVEAESALRLELKSGSRIVALPGDPSTVRGFSAPRLVIVDEAARVEDAMLAALRPMLATSKRGRLVMLSTPAGRRGAFYEAWIGEAGEWDRLSVTADDCPRISAAFLAEERVALGPALFAQEYETEFREAPGQLFDEGLLASLIRSDVAPLFEDSEWTLAEVPAIEAKALPPREARIEVVEPYLPTFHAMEK